MTTACPQPKPGIVPFAMAITFLNVLGHLWLGFEQAWLTPFVAAGTAYASELFIEVLVKGPTKARFRGGFRQLVFFLLPAHISAMAVAMLLYTGERFMVVAFAAALAIFSKVLFRVPVPGAPPGVTTHFLNPSNFGIAVTLLLYSDWVGVAPPYQFTENVSGVLDWLIPAIIVCSGSFLNWRATKRLPLVLGWLSGFAGQAVIRGWMSEASVWPFLAPMTGMAFVLFTFYMVTDPMTTPKGFARQVVFGMTTAIIYGLLSYIGIVFGLFFSLSLVCMVRGATLVLSSRMAHRNFVATDGSPNVASPIRQ